MPNPLWEARGERCRSAPGFQEVEVASLLPARSVEQAAEQPWDAPSHTWGAHIHRVGVRNLFTWKVQKG